MFKNTIKRAIAPAVMELIEERPVVVNLEKLVEKIEITAPTDKAEKKAMTDDITDALAKALDYARHRGRIRGRIRRLIVDDRIVTRVAAVKAALKLLFFAVWWRRLNLHLTGLLSGRAKKYLQPPTADPSLELFQERLVQTLRDSLCSTRQQEG